MPSKRRNVNISLIILSFVLGVWAVGIILQPNSESISEAKILIATDTLSDISTPSLNLNPENDTAANAQERMVNTAQSTTYIHDSNLPADTRFRDANLSALGIGNPFREEAQKVMSGRLEETDSASRHRILSYCEHLRTSYTTRDIDFIRQVFSDNALIIIGHTIRTGSKETAGNGNRKVSYAIRSKKEYLERLERIFNSNSKIDVGFSDFKILRHPTMEGIYGVTLRQKYSCDRYSDDGYLFLLWDFRDRSMPLIHVRTWQPTPDILEGGEDVIEIGDFNLE